MAGDSCGGLFVLNQRGNRKWDTNSGVTLVSFGESVEAELFGVGYLEGTIHRVRLKGRRP